MLKKKKVVTVMAHPDDVELKCFGTLCKYCESGYKCTVIIVCGGENGISLEDRKKTGINLISRDERVEETRKAFTGTNIEIKMLNLKDGETNFSRDLIVAIEEELRRIRPEIVITHFADNFGVDHQDHFNVGKATVNCATRLECVKKIMLCEPQMALRANFIPNCFVDISKYFKKKVGALLCHQTQSGRFYLKEEYHKIRARYYAENVGYEKARSGKEFESFLVSLLVE